MGAFILMSSFLLVACNFGKSGDRNIEAAFSKDSAVVMIADFSDGTQVENFNHLIDQFPTTGFMGLLPKAFNSNGLEGNLSWKEDVGPILAAEWEVGFGIVAVGGEDFKETDSIDFVFAAKFSENEKVKALLNKFMATKKGFWANVEYEKNGGVEYWTEPSNSLYLAFSKNVFVAAPKEEGRKVAVDRLNGNEGLNKNSNFEVYDKKIGGGFFTYYFDVKAFGLDKLKAANGIDFGNNIGEMLSTMDGAYIGLFAEKDGFRSLSELNVDEKSKGFSKMLSDPNYRISLINKVNSEGLFFYIENGSLKDGFLGYLIDGSEGMEKEAMVEENGEEVVDGSLQTNVLGALGMNDRPVLLSEKVVSSALDGELLVFLKKIDVLLSSPYAVSISDKENYLPAIAFYFQLKDADVQNAKNLVADVDVYVDKIVEEINKIVTTGEGQSFIKKDILASNGGALHKVYVDWKSAPKDLVTEWSTKSGIDVTSVKNEFYYGLMGDNVFVLAWYPDFPTVYGQDVLANNTEYKEAFKKLNGTYGMSVSYLNTKSLITFVDKFLKMAVTMNTSDGIGKDLALGYVKLAEKFIGTMQYSISSSEFKDGKLTAEGFVRIQKVQDEPVK